jgi:hypothetical protein
MDCKAKAKHLVERAIVRTIGVFRRHAEAEWERLPLGTLLKFPERLDPFLQNLLEEIRLAGLDPNDFQFLDRDDRVGLLRDPVTMIIRFVEAPMRRADFRERLKAGDPEAVAAWKQASKNLFYGTA